MYITKIVKTKRLQCTGSVLEMNSENILWYRISSIVIEMLYEFLFFYRDYNCVGRS
jgi:hypothetical protein